MTDFYPYIVVGAYAAAALCVAYYLGRRTGQKISQPSRDDRGRFVKR